MRGVALFFALLCTVWAGCTQPAQTVRPRSWLDRWRTPAPGTDIVQLDVALLERPVGDPFIDRELWKYTDEQTVPLAQKAALDDNGFRVGQIVGLPPGKLQALWSSERSCINPRRQLLPPGRATIQLLGPTLPRAEFQVKENGQTAEVAVEDSQFVLEVTPALTDNGRIRLRFTPKIQYGEKVPELRPAADGSGWTYELSRPSKHFPTVTWEVTVGPNEFLVIGGSSEQPESLGFHAFIQLDAAVHAQRLLVLRADRFVGEQTATLEDLARHSPPLAEQAAFRAQGQ